MAAAGFCPWFLLKCSKVFNAKDTKDTRDTNDLFFRQDLRDSLPIFNLVPIRHQPFLMNFFYLSSQGLKISDCRFGA